MSSEKFAPAFQTESKVCEPDSTSSSTVVTKCNQQVYTQQIITRQIRKVNQKIESDNFPDNQSLVLMEKSPHVDVKRTTKTYCRRIIRHIGPNGEVSEEIIEGESIPDQIFTSHPLALENKSLREIRGPSNEGFSNQVMRGGDKFQATVGFNSVSETGESRSMQFCTGPMEFSFKNLANQIPSLENNIDISETDSGNQLVSINNPLQSTHQILKDGSIVTRKFYGEKSATVTHSSTINGQTQTSSKSAFMTFSGENMLEAKSSIDNMEMILGQMMAGIKADSLNIFNKFISSNQSSMVDHLALAGGDNFPSLLALEPPKYISNKSIEGVPETINEHLPLPQISQNESKEQQEEAMIQNQIKVIKDSKASNRLYWSHMEEVKTSGILKNMAKEEIHLQEAIFEIITSEASYNISLDTLIEFYYNSELLNPNKPDSIINPIQKHHLFSNILLIKTVSLNLLKDLENRWSHQKPKITDLSDIILKHADDKEFQQQYINYLTNQSYQINCLKTLLQKENFKQALIAIQSNPQCCKLSLDSFLALPMQRLTRLKLLLEVVMKLMHQSEELFKKIPKTVVENCQEALNKLKELLTTSENSKYKLEQKARLIDLSKILEFTGPVKNIAIGSKELIMEGEVRASISQICPNALKKLSKKRQPFFYLIVLNDLVIIAKKKSPTKLVVLEYCEKNKVQATIGQNSLNLSLSSKGSRASIGSQVSLSSQLSVSSNESISQTNAGCSFILKFNRETDAVITDPLVLITTTIDLRDQWISAITSN